MPNWSYNRVTVKGDKDEIKKFKEFVKGVRETEDGHPDVFSFQSIIPMPKELDITSTILADDKSKWSDEDKELAKAYEINTKKYGAKDWYEWRWKFWDTKWDACDVYIDDESEDEVTYVFDTAWSFPTIIAIALTDKFPTLEFDWSATEESGEYDFGAELKNGKVIGYREFQRNDDDDEIQVTELPVSDFITEKQFAERRELIKIVEGYGK